MPARGQMLPQGAEAAPLSTGTSLPPHRLKILFPGGLRQAMQPPPPPPPLREQRPCQKDTMVFWGCRFLPCHLSPLLCIYHAPFCSLLHFLTMSHAMSHCGSLLSAFVALFPSNFGILVLRSQSGRGGEDLFSGNPNQLTATLTPLFMTTCPLCQRCRYGHRGRLRL